MLRKGLLWVQLVLSVGSVFGAVLINPRDKSISLADLVGLVSTVISVLGLDNEAKKATHKERRESQPFWLTPSFDSGLYGGLLGGALAGLIIGLMYYTSSQTLDELRYGPDIRSAGWEIVLHIFMYASVAGALLGAASQLLCLWFRHLATQGQGSPVALNEVSGGTLGGLIAWLPVGAAGGWFFGLRPLPFVNLGVLVTGAVLGALAIVLGALLYDFAGHWRRVGRALFVAAIIAFFAIFLGGMVLSFLGVEKFFPWGASVLQVAEGGAIIGGVLGGVLGLQIGLTLYLYRRWEGMAKPPETASGCLQ